MKAVLKRYRAFLITALAIGVFTLFNSSTGLKALTISGNSLKEMLLMIPPIFILLGLLDVWVPREAMIKYMGEGSGGAGCYPCLYHWVGGGRTALRGVPGGSRIHEKRGQIL